MKIFSNDSASQDNLRNSELTLYHCNENINMTPSYNSATKDITPHDFGQGFYATTSQIYSLNSYGDYEN